MKKRLTGKPACIAILSVLIVISAAEIILRGVILRGASLNVSNTGEPIITALFSLMLIVFAAKEKDRLFYILCGAFLGYFVLNQLFGLPAIAADFVASLSAGPGRLFLAFVTFFHLLSIIGIVAIGGLLVEYMNDGTIYNKAFNTLCIITVLLLTSHIATNVFAVIAKQENFIVLAILNNLSRMAMVFLFAFFAYDTAKAQLAKTKL